MYNIYIHVYILSAKWTRGGGQGQTEMWRTFGAGYVSPVEGRPWLMNIATWKPPINALSLARSATWAVFSSTRRRLLSTLRHSFSTSRYARSCCLRSRGSHHSISSDGMHLPCEMLAGIFPDTAPPKLAWQGRR